ncbi:MAG: hypothetical protein JNJ75_05870 [Cyclobacteriaceae bacterium]|nr:hypothetical protein [Cyclobacteriaceae bacterium]
MTTQQIQNLKKATEALTKWESSGKAFGHYSNIEPKATNEEGADMIYEFYCLMRILEDLMHNYEVTLVPGTKKGKIFPQKPGAKKGWAYFVIINKMDGNNKFQVCYGTNIKLSLAPRTTIAPDVSIQKYDSTDDPDESMVELIMDAKFKYDDSTALPIEQLHGFMQRVSALGVQAASSMTLAFNLLSGIKSNCLLTNGRALHNQHDYCVLNHIKQVEQFDIGSAAFNVIG